MRAYACVLPRYPLNPADVGPSPDTPNTWGVDGRDPDGPRLALRTSCHPDLLLACPGLGLADEERQNGRKFEDLEGLCEQCGGGESCLDQRSRIDQRSRGKCSSL